MDSKFNTLFDKIITEQKEANILNEGFFGFGNKSEAKEISQLCKQNWAEHDYVKLQEHLKQYKRKYTKQFNNDGDAKFYYGMMMIKNLIHENRMILRFKSIISEAKVGDDMDDPDVYQSLKDLTRDDVKRIKHKALFGDPDSLYELAICYYLGGYENKEKNIKPVIRKDIKKAIKYFRKAAEKGVPEAQYNLGVMYENGREQGTPQENEFQNYINKDEQEALKWYFRASKQGYEPATENYNRLSKQRKETGKSEDKWKDIEELDNTTDQETLRKGLQYIKDARENSKEAFNWWSKNWENIKAILA